MKILTTQRITSTLCIAGLALVLIAGATTAQAQDREDRWEFSLGLPYQLSGDMEFKGGSTVETQDDFGFEMMSGYHFTDKVATTFGFQWMGVGYDSDVVLEDGTTQGIRGTYDTWSLQGNLIYHLIDGPFTPYIGAGIGYTFIDTNIPTGLPSTGCWWDPWYGYVCSTYYPTKTTNSFSYQAMLGLRYEFNGSTFLRLDYTSQWIDISNSVGTPRFDVIGVDFGWMF